MTDYFVEKYQSRQYDRCIEYLYELFEQSQELHHWLPTRFENGHMDEDGDYRIWSIHSEIIGILTNEGDHYYPNSSEPKVLREMLEFLLNKYGRDGQQFWVHNAETNRTTENILSEYGFAKKKVGGFLRTWNGEFPERPEDLPEGFQFTELTEDYRDAYAAAVREVFGHKNFTEAQVEYLQTRSFWHQELDLLVTDQGDEIAAFSTFRVDPSTNFVELEPLGTRPAYRGLGLAKKVIRELLYRVRSWNPPLIYIGGAADTPAANAVYDAAGFDSQIVEWMWAPEPIR